MTSATTFSFSVSIENEILDGVNPAKKREGGQKSDGKCHVVISRVLCTFQSVSPEPFLVWTLRALQKPLACRQLGLQKRSLPSETFPGTRGNPHLSSRVTLSSVIYHFEPQSPPPRKKKRKMGMLSLSNSRYWNKPQCLGSSAQKQPISSSRHSPGRMVLVSGRCFFMQGLEDSGLFHAVGPPSLQGP